MSKTQFSNKCDILGALWLFYREQADTNEAWRVFFEYNDVGLPLAYLLSYETVIPNPDNKEAVDTVEETWDMFCSYIEIDPDGEYSVIEDCFAASKLPPLEDKEKEDEPATA